MEKVNLFTLPRDLWVVIFEQAMNGCKHDHPLRNTDEVVGVFIRDKAKLKKRTIGDSIKISSTKLFNYMRNLNLSNSESVKTETNKKEQTCLQFYCSLRQTNKYFKSVADSTAIIKLMHMHLSMVVDQIKNPIFCQDRRESRIKKAIRHHYLPFIYFHLKIDPLNLNAKNVTPFDDTMLHCAAYSSEVVTRYLLSLPDTNVNSLNRFNYTPIYYAEGKIIKEMLINRGAIRIED